jgi:Domain of unknown function (DUF4136)
MLNSEKSWYHSTPKNIAAMLVLFALLLVFAPQSIAKTAVDFDPNLNFSKFKTFAYAGGSNALEFRELNPNYISERVHAGVAQALVQRGLREVPLDQQPDLVVRYWANSQSNMVAPAAGAGDIMTSGYWAYTYDLMRAEDSLDATLVIDLTDAKRKALAWRIYLEQKIVDDDSIWPKVLTEISKGFEHFPPSKKEIAEKQKERAEHPPKPPSQ